MPFSNDQAESGRENFAAQALFVGEITDDVVVEGFGVDQAGEVAGCGHVGILLMRGEYCTYVLFARRKRGEEGVKREKVEGGGIEIGGN